ncbi:MAG: peptidylprolyl isomerase [Flavobacteriaceae bacterium]|nr:peptidylprolyl isomerase [Flavobacteriaceae bacterium]
MKKLLLLFIIYISILSCEDTKKPSIKKEIETTTLEKNLNQNIEKNISSKKNIYPKITQENVVQFLTDYGNINPESKARIITIFGNIDLKLFTDTPLHRSNFIFMVKQGYYNNTFFHRVVPNFIIQGGSSDLKDTSKKRAEIGSNYRLPYEKGNGRIHKFGTISGAKHYRKNPDNLSVPFEFFIFLGPKSSTIHLNGNYTIFGKVTKGMDIVEKIANLPTDGDGWPIENIYISAEIIK